MDKEQRDKLMHQTSDHDLIIVLGKNSLGKKIWEKIFGKKNLGKNIWEKKFGKKMQGDVEMY